MIARRNFAAIAADSALAPALVGRAAFAQAWPTRFVRFVVPFPAGVAPDIGCRVLTARLSEIWGCRPWSRTSRAPAATDGRIHARRECVALPVDLGAMLK